MTLLSPSAAERRLAPLREYLGTPFEAILSRAAGADPDGMALSLFGSASREVPAYARFLAAAGVDPASVRTIADFRRVPPTTKENYHRKHPLPDLCRGGVLGGCDMVAVSSGTTGEPTVWPRFARDEVPSAERFEQVFADGFEAASRTTLAVVCFALGSWVGGMYTTACCRHLAAKGYAVTVVTPGNQKGEILRVVRALGGFYDQVVMLGYPPFLKDVVDAARADGLDLAAYHPRFVMAGEVFSEEWRTLLCERAGAGDPVHATASLYGTADGGVLASETPFGVHVRRFLASRPDAVKEVFGEARLPTLCQYDPTRRYFEEEEQSLIFSSDGSVPLVRYRILDRGGVIGFDAMLERLRDLGHPGAPPSVTARRMPFVYVFGRSSSAVSFYGANVHAENVSPGLLRLDVAGQVTGKFVMQVTEDADRNAVLELKVELAPGATASDSLRSDVAREVRASIESQNSEFRGYAPDERRTPSVELVPHGDPVWFPVGVKHRYTR